MWYVLYSLTTSRHCVTLLPLQLGNIALQLFPRHKLSLQHFLKRLHFSVSATTYMTKTVLVTQTQFNSVSDTIFMTHVQCTEFS